MRDLFDALWWILLPIGVLVLGVSVFVFVGATLHFILCIFRSLFRHLIYGLKLAMPLRVGTPPPLPPKSFYQD